MKLYFDRAGSEEGSQRGAGVAITARARAIVSRIGEGHRRLHRR